MRITSAHVHSNGASAEPAKGGSAAGSFFAALSGAAQGASTSSLLGSALGGDLSGDEIASGQDGKGGAEAEGAGGFSLAQGGDDPSTPAAGSDGPHAANVASMVPSILSFAFPIVNLVQAGAAARTAGADAKAEAGDASGPSSKTAKTDSAAASQPVDAAMNALALPAGAERLPVLPVHGYAAAGGKADAQPNRNGVLPLPDLSSVTNAAERVGRSEKDVAGNEGAKQPASENGSGDGKLDSANAGSTGSVDGTGQASAAAQTSGQGFSVPVDQTASAAVTNAANGAQPVDNANSKADSNPLLSSNSNSGGTTTGSSSDAGKAGTPDAATGAVVTASQAVVAGGQTAQHAPVELAPGAATVKAADGGAPDVQLMPTRAAGQDAGLPQRTAVGAGELPRPGELHGDSAAESGEIATASGVNVAKLMQAMSGTEMHVGMSSAEFGDISIRASVSQQQMMAQISLDHNDLGQAILAHVSTVQAKLGNEYGMQASIAVQHQGTATAGDSGQSQQREQRGFSRSGKGGSAAPPAEIESGGGVHPVSMTTAMDISRLDIQA